MENIMAMFEQLEDMIDEAPKVPFTENVMINRNLLLELSMDIKLQFPNALKQAEWVVQERNKILTDASKVAEGNIKESERQASKLVAENEITRKAYEQAEKIVDSAKKTAREMKLGALAYSDDVLVKLEESLKEAMESFHNSFMAIETNYSNALQMVNQNRQELRGINKKSVDEM